MRTRTAGTARRTGTVAALAALVLGATTACGGDDADKLKKPDTAATSTAEAKDPKDPGQVSEPPALEEQPKTVNPEVKGVGAGGGKELTKAELDAAVLATGDVSTFKSAPMDGPPAQGETADKPDCAPLTAMINGKPEPEPSAVVYRQLVGAKTGRPAISEFLATHGTQGATSLLNRLSEAVKDCEAGFKGTGAGSTSTYAAVKRLDVPKAGDDTLAYQVTGEFEGDPVPMVFQLVRVGGTVATFYTANFEGATTPEIPSVLLATQAVKLK
ncbi:hypothetical protein GCM10011583_53850 [Streptomyces camponoticapitis]|uniref:Lipoprotein n=1 Tax=Streptomyces camponoticapitis TaxID=1616125 RepID=A0ABQ2ENC5_9ACTN|nr:hypothetical protein [Streptomyces camponoticapitis]GGK15038.1 hypothetical protein GCM10011583_53850 [Streptomyces camponoticapitis]